jgi:hypothetical protein
MVSLLLKMVLPENGTLANLYPCCNTTTFSSVHRVAQVNTFWREVSLVPDVWREIRFKARQTKEESQDHWLAGRKPLRFLLKNRFNHVRVLDTLSASAFSDAKLQVKHSYLTTFV